MSWRLARSLVQLRMEIDQLAPKRSKANDGTIGDAAHAARASRHNPNNYDVVTALDITHDPGNGCDIHALAREIAKNPHPNLSYIVSNREVASRSRNWVWRAYSGSSPHTGHAHFGVGIGPDADPQPPYDDQTPWLKWRSTDMTPEERIRLNRGRVSDIAQSYDIAILDAKMEAVRETLGILDWPERVADLKERKQHDVVAEKAKLGL